MIPAPIRLPPLERAELECEDLRYHNPDRHAKMTCKGCGKPWTDRRVCCSEVELIREGGKWYFPGDYDRPTHCIRGYCHVCCPEHNHKFIRKPVFCKSFEPADGSYGFGCNLWVFSPDTRITQAVRWLKSRGVDIHAKPLSPSMFDWTGRWMNEKIHIHRDGTYCLFITQYVHCDI